MTYEKVSGQTPDYQKGYSAGRSKQKKEDEKIIEKLKYELSHMEISKVYPYSLIYDLIGDRDDVPEISLRRFSETVGSCLNEREKRIMELRRRDGKTLKEVAEMIGVNGERIRQIEAHSERKLRGRLVTFLMEESVPKREYQALMARYEGLKARHEQVMTSINETSPVPVNEEGVHDIPIEDIEMSVRTFNCLKRAKVNRLSQLLTLTEEQMLHIRNLGRKSAKEIMRIQTMYGGQYETD